MTDLPIERKQTMHKTIIRPERLRNSSNLSGPVARSEGPLVYRLLACATDKRRHFEQANLVIDELEEILIQSGGTLDDVVSIFSLHLDLLTIDQVIKTAARRFGKTPPAWTAARDRWLWDRGNDPRFAIIADLHPGAASTPARLPAGEPGGAPSAASGKGSLLFVRADRRSSLTEPSETNVRHIEQSATGVSEDMGALLDKRRYHLEHPQRAEPTFTRSMCQR